MNAKLVAGALGKCNDRSEVEEVFNKFKVEAIEEKTEMLMLVMDKPDFFFSVGEPNSEQKYELVLESFLSMSWKFALMCKRGSENEQ